MSRQQDFVPRSVSPTILVVDDELAITKLCKTILQQAGFSVLDADGSSEALKICTQHEGPIDLLITDLILPPPGFQLASSTNQFPHVHGHDLAVRALHIRKDLRISSCQAISTRIWQGTAYAGGTSHFFPNRLSTKPWWHSCDRLFTRLRLRSKV